ncbi:MULTISPECIES: MmpS family transport accessory protein [Nocardia]|uniref:MmpS family transport accessory protein n=1 Tax=Nocardia TaxID=1817 RepID=UPI0013009875|nr:MULTISPECIES: MmpS family transport accessory protein [Nocardia]
MTATTPALTQHQIRRESPIRRKSSRWISAAVLVLMLGGCTTHTGQEQATPAAASASSTITPTTAVSSPTVVAPTTTAPTSPSRTVVYEIDSDAPALNSVTYSDEVSRLIQDVPAVAPWRKTILNTTTLTNVGLGASTTGTWVTCRIFVDGVPRDEKSATGQYATTTCASIG